MNKNNKKEYKKIIVEDEDQDDDFNLEMDEITNLDNGHIDDIKDKNTMMLDKIKDRISTVLIRAVNEHNYYLLKPVKSCNLFVKLKTIKEIKLVFDQDTLREKIIHNQLNKAALEYSINIQEIKEQYKDEQFKLNYFIDNRDKFININNKENIYQLLLNIITIKPMTIEKYFNNLIETMLSMSEPSSIKSLLIKVTSNKIKNIIKILKDEHGLELDLDFSLLDKQKSKDSHLFEVSLN